MIGPAVKRLPLRACAFALLIAGVFFLSTVSAAEEAGPMRRVFDDAGLFSREQSVRLEDALLKLRTETGGDFAVVTTADAEGKSAMDYADDFYDDNGLGTGDEKDGALLLIDLDNRELYISTCGAMILNLTGAEIEQILDDAFPFLTAGNYAQAAEAFIEGVQVHGMPSTARPSPALPGSPAASGETAASSPVQIISDVIENHTAYFVVILIFSLAAGGLSCAAVHARYRMKTPAYSYPYQQNSTLKLTVSEDIFLRETTTKRHIPPPPKTGGGSSHSSRGGRSHGGVGRRF